jgi:hypothetical protein
MMRKLILVALSLLPTACGGPELQLWHTAELNEEFGDH